MCQALLQPMRTWTYRHKLKLQYFDHLMTRANSLEKTLLLGKTEGKGRREWQRTKGFMASLTQWHVFEQTLGCDLAAKKQQGSDLSQEFGDGAWAHAKSLQSCQILCKSVDCSPPGSSVHGIFQTRTQEGVAMSVSRGSFRPRDWTLCLLRLLHCRQILYRWTTREASMMVVTFWFSNKTPGICSGKRSR